MKKQDSTKNQSHYPNQSHAGLTIVDEFIKGRLLYVGDPMCSWCWGFTNQLDKTIKAYQNTLEFEIILGGLRPGGGDVWNDDMKSFLRRHWEHVNKRTGQPFRYDLLEREHFNYDTEPACRAVRVIRDLMPEKEFEFFRRIQYAFYVENEDPTQNEFYRDICNQVELDFNRFVEMFETDDYKTKVNVDFNRSYALRIRGFPTLLLLVDGKRYTICYGYADHEKMQSTINAILD